MPKNLYVMEKSLCNGGTGKGTLFNTVNSLTLEEFI